MQVSKRFRPYKRSNNNNKVKRRVCKCHHTGKIKYDTEREALERIEILRIVGAVWRREQHTYQCRHCGAWHLTSR